MFKNYNEPARESEIKAPKKGDVVSRKEYNETVKKKMEEMRTMYGGRRNKREIKDIQINERFMKNFITTIFLCNEVLPDFLK